MKYYHLLEEEAGAHILGCWEKHLMGYSRVVGYSATGAIFLRNPETSDYLILYPGMPGNNCKKYGSFTSTKEFEKKILKDDDFQNYGLYPIKPGELPTLVERLGPCEKDQVYFPVPDPSIGGSGKLDTFKKGNVWVYADIIGQNKGL